MLNTEYYMISQLRNCFALILAIGICSGCRSEPNHVEFVIPKGFHGTLVVRPGELGARPLEKSGSHYIVRMPKNGVLGFDGYDPFTRYVCTARFDDGSPIWIPNGVNGTIPAGQIGFFGGYTNIEIDDNDRQVVDMRWFVGTEKQWKSSNE
jgi:hypothetical protein